MKKMKIQILSVVVLLGSAVAVQGSMSRLGYTAYKTWPGQMRFSSGVQGRESKPAKLNWILSGKDKAAYLKFRGIEETPEELEEEMLVPSEEYAEYLQSLPRVPRQKDDKESYPFPEVKVIVNPNYKPRQQQQELQELKQEENQEKTQGGWGSWLKGLLPSFVSEKAKKKLEEERKLAETKREQERKDVKDLMRRTIQSKLFPVGSAMSEDSIVDVLEMSDRNPELKGTMNADDLRYSHWDDDTRAFFNEQYEAYLTSGQKWKNYYRNFDDAVNDRMEEKFSKKEYKKQRDEAFLEAGYSPEDLSIDESDYNVWKAQRGWGGHFPQYIFKRK